MKNELVELDLKLKDETSQVQVLDGKVQLDEKMIAGVINFIINKEVVLAFYISHDEAYKEYRPVNLLFYTIFGWAIESHFKIYDFGTFTVDGSPNMGLGRFKENFGASGIFRDTIEFKF